MSAAGGLVAQVVLAIGALLGGGGLWGLYSAVQVKRKLAAEGVKTEAEGAQVITSTALTLLAPLRAEVEEARKEATEARREATDARRELDDVSRKARALVKALDESHDRERQYQQENTELRATNARLEDELTRRRERHN